MDIFNSSHYFLNLHGIPFLISGTTVVALGVFVLARSPRAVLHISFFFVCLAVGIWLLGFGAGYMSAAENIARIWFFVGFNGVVYISTFNYFFTVSLLKTVYRQRWIVGALFIVTTFFLVQLYATPGFYLGVEQYSWGYYGRLGTASYPFLIFFFAVMLAAFAQYFLSWRKESNPLERKKILAIFLAYLIGYLAALDYLPVYGITYYPLGPTPLLVWIVFIVYTIIRYQLFRVTPAIAAPAIISTMADALLVAGEDGTVIIANKAAASTLGYSLRHLIGHPLSEFLPIAENLLKKASTLPAKENVLTREEETMLKTDKGTNIPVSLSAAVIRNPSGRIAGITAICHNLSKIKEYVTTLDSQKQNLEQANKTLEETNAKLTREKETVEKINKILVNREMRIIELKKRVGELEKR